MFEAGCPSLMQFNVPNITTVYCKMFPSTEGENFEFISYWSERIYYQVNQSSYKRRAHQCQLVKRQTIFIPLQIYNKDPQTPHRECGWYKTFC